jgi:hypothetical protein
VEAKTYSGLENALIAPVGVGRLLHLLVGRFRVDDAVLAGDLLAVALLVLLLLLQKGLDRVAEVVVEVLELPLLDCKAAVRRALRVGLELLDLAADRRVLELRRRHQVVQLLPHAVIAAGESLLVQGGDVRDAHPQTVDVFADCCHALEELGLREDAPALLLRRGRSVLLLW